MSKKGFTLTEILIVMIVAGILLALILPNTLKALERANVTKRNNNLHTIDTAIYMCYSEERDWTNCKDVNYLETNGHLEPGVIGEDPFGGVYSTYDRSNDPNLNIQGFIGCVTTAGTVPKGALEGCPPVEQN